MKIGIIGAGWFGCHIGSELLNEGHEIVIYEKEKQIFFGASGNNQNRLHLGFHYPRSSITREQSKKGFYFFKKNYPKFSTKINKNLYGISKSKDSVIDFKTYLQILKSSGLSFKVLKTKKYSIENVTGLIKCHEEFIDIEKAKKFFLKKLKNKIMFDYEVANLKKINKKFFIGESQFDLIINCSWQQFLMKKEWDIKYEICVSLLYKSEKKVSKAITIMDGPFYTMYPFSNKTINLYSVKYSRYKKFSNFSKIKKTLKTIKKIDLEKIRNIMEKEFITYYPNFKKEHKFKKFLITTRSIIDQKDDSRDYKVSYEDGLFNVMSGKIDHIFLASKDIIKCIKNFS